MDLDAKTFAILSLCGGGVVALLWDWVAHLLDDMDDEWWKDIEDRDVDENDRPKRREK